MDEENTFFCFYFGITDFIFFLSNHDDYNKDKLKSLIKTVLRIITKLM